MERINTTNKAVDLFGAGKHGFQDGNPGAGVFATFLSAAFFNAVQEEIAHVIEAVGTALNPADRTQLLAAIDARIATLASGLPTDGSGLMTGDVVIANNRGIKIKNSGAAAIYALVRTATDVLQLGGAANNPIEVLIDSTMRAVFDVAGRMGVGRTPDSELFEVGGGLRSVVSGIDARLRSNAGQVEVGAWSAHDLAFIANGAVAARISTAGIFSCGLLGGLTANDYVRLPNGIYVQWGTGSANMTGVGVSFPVAFPTQCFGVVNVCNNQTNPPAAQVTGLSPGGFTATVSAGSPGIYYFAIGV